MSLGTKESKAESPAVTAQGETAAGGPLQHAQSPEARATSVSREDSRRDRSRLPWPCWEGGWDGGENGDHPAAAAPGSWYHHSHLWDTKDSTRCAALWSWAHEVLLFWHHKEGHTGVPGEKLAPLCLGQKRNQVSFISDCLPKSFSGMGCIKTLFFLFKGEKKPQKKELKARNNQQHH